MCKEKKPENLFCIFSLRTLIVQHSVGGVGGERGGGAALGVWDGARPVITV